MDGRDSPAPGECTPTGLRVPIWLAHEIVTIDLEVLRRERGTRLDDLLHVGLEGLERAQIRRDLRALRSDVGLVEPVEESRRT
jgi:hypothetical protein